MAEQHHTFHLRLTHSQHGALRNHLFPGDGLEAVAFLLCGQRAGETRHIFTAKEVIPLPHEEAIRDIDSVTWSTDFLDNLVSRLFGTNHRLVKVHSHPEGYQKFSATDDRSDTEVLGSLCRLLGEGHHHGSSVMLPNGRMFGRIVTDAGIGPSFDSIAVIGDDIDVWRTSEVQDCPDYSLRTQQAFGEGTINVLRNLTIAIVGCSGTGSIVAELLTRLGVGHLVLVDPDIVEKKNLNRILNSTMEDALQGRKKVDVIAQAIREMGLGTLVTPIATSLDCANAVRSVAECDAVFGCVDTLEGRHLINRLATYYVLPYFDVGVRLDADGNGGVDGIAGAVHYIQPGRSSLASRKMYNMEQLRSEETKRTNPSLYREELKQGYLRGVREDRPAVITINTFYASLAVQELLARLHRFRNRPNAEYAYLGANLLEVQFHTEEERGECEMFRRHLGTGDVEPLLGRPSLT